MSQQLKLGAFLPGNGHHVAAWRHPNAQANGGINFQHYQNIAQTAERGKFDMVFLADNVAVWGWGKGTKDLTRSGQIIHFEPLTLLSALSVVTEHIGLAATASTTYNEPYHLARKFASLDHLSSGRAGWNLVTSATEAEAKNFSRDKHMEHMLRYERAKEFVDVVTSLWDSWEDDAFVRDKESGVYFDSDKLHVANHKGEHFSVLGPLNVARPPQGYPVIIQAGSSLDGKNLAAQTAEVIFTAQQTLAEAQAFYIDVKQRVAKYGRNPDDVKIMPGMFPVIGSTEQEALEKYEQLQELIHPSVGLALLSGLIGGIDLSKYPLDEPLPDLPETNLHKSRLQLLTDLAQREKLTIRQLYLRIAGARGHRTIIGTPEQIADKLEEWFINGGADGYNIMPPYLPDGLNEFVDLVIPELQRRGLILRAIVIPPTGGDTVWANSVTAYEDLPAHLRSFADQLWAVHSNAYDYAAAAVDVPEEIRAYRNVFTSFFNDSGHVETVNLRFLQGLWFIEFYLRYTSCAHRAVLTFNQI